MRGLPASLSPEPLEISQRVYSKFIGLSRFLSIRNRQPFNEVQPMIRKRIHKRKWRSTGRSSLLKYRLVEVSISAPFDSLDEWLEERMHRRTVLQDRKLFFGVVNKQLEKLRKKEKGI